MTLLVTAHVYLCYGVNCQSMWTISFVLRPSHHSLFDYWTGNNDIITHYHLPQQIPHNGFPPGGVHAGPDCGSTGSPLTDLWSNPPRETNINKHILLHTPLPNNL